MTQHYGLSQFVRKKERKKEQKNTQHNTIANRTIMSPKHFMTNLLLRHGQP